METLTEEEFAMLSFYSVNRLIDMVFKTKIQKAVNNDKMTLR